MELKVGTTSTSSLVSNSIFDKSSFGAPRRAIVAYFLRLLRKVQTKCITIVLDVFAGYSRRVSTLFNRKTKHCEYVWHLTTRTVLLFFGITCSVSFSTDRMESQMSPPVPVEMFVKYQLKW